jgi:RNA polymerase sigma factor (sigma-70 family)
MNKFASYTDQKLLIQALKEEEPEAIRYLYLKLYSRTELIILNNRGIKEDVKDIFQESIIALLLCFRKPDFQLSKSTVENYFLGIVKFKWLQHLKSKRNVISDDYLLEIQCGEIQNVDDKQSSFISLLWNHFGVLKEDCKSTLSYFFYENKSGKEVAQILGFTEEYVRIKKMRCLQYLRESILKSKEYLHEFN